MSFFRRKELLILLLGLILLVVLLGYSLSKKSEDSFPQQFVKDTVGVGQKIVHGPVSFITDVFHNVKDIKNTYEENKVLKEKISDSKSLIFDNQSLKDENEELRELMDEKDSIRDYNPIQASVISRSPERWIEQVTLNKGEQAGIEKNMAVITAEGMVGKVMSVSQFSSTVKLISGFDEFNRISAQINPEKGDSIYGLIEGYDVEKSSLTFRMIGQEKIEIEKGELVFSSGLGGLYPAGLAIGEVTEVVPDRFGLTQSVLIKPGANLNEINNVIVVDRTLDLHDPDESSEEEAEEEIVVEEEEIENAD